MGQKILIVDDDAVILTTVRKMLERSDYDVIEATNGKEAIATVQKEKPDLVIMDANMPVMDGWTAIMKLREDEEFKKLPIITLTAVGDVKDTATACGSDLFVSKDNLNSELLDSVQKLLDK